MAEAKVSIRRLREPQDAQQAYCCMTEVPTPWPEALCMCRDWLQENLGRYVEGFHLERSDGSVIGQLYYALSEQALFPYLVEPKAGVLYCEWVQQRYQGRGHGRALFAAFRDQMEARGAKGILVEATDHPARMHFSHYLKRGFQLLRSEGHRRLLYLPLASAKIEVAPLQPRIHPQPRTPVQILVLSGYMCPFEAASLSALKEVVQEFGERVSLQQVRLTPDSLQKYGAASGIFVNGERKLAGGEPEEAIRQAILEAL
jgi:GNAT superfamily N-acetyltransferase